MTDSRLEDLSGGPAVRITPPVTPRRESQVTPEGLRERVEKMKDVLPAAEGARARKTTTAPKEPKAKPALRQAARDKEVAAGDKAVGVGSGDSGGDEAEVGGRSGNL